MLASKGSGRHPSAGTVYGWGLAVLFITMSWLSIIRWPADNLLWVLGALSLGAGAVGREARRRRWPLGVHVTGMAASYILMLTAFYVDNGPNLPVWRLLPEWAYLVAPSVVGVPILIWALTHHPLLTAQRKTLP